MRVVWKPLVEVTVVCVCVSSRVVSNCQALATSVGNTRVGITVVTNLPEKTCSVRAITRLLWMMNRIDVDASYQLPTPFLYFCQDKTPSRRRCLNFGETWREKGGNPTTTYTFPLHIRMTTTCRRLSHHCLRHMPTTTGSMPTKYLNNFHQAEECRPWKAAIANQNFLGSAWSFKLAKLNHSYREGSLLRTFYVSRRRAPDHGPILSSRYTFRTEPFEYL